MPSVKACVLLIPYLFIRIRRLTKGVTIVPLSPLPTDMRESMLATLNDHYVLYPQRVRYFCYLCKEQLDGRSRSALVKRLDQIMRVALQQTEEWHSHFRTWISEAVEHQAFHTSDHDFFLLHLEKCKPRRGEKRAAIRTRRIKQIEN